MHRRNLRRLAHEITAGQVGCGAAQLGGSLLVRRNLRRLLRADAALTSSSSCLSSHILVVQNALCSRTRLGFGQACLERLGGQLVFARSQQTRALRRPQFVDRLVHLSAILLSRSVERFDLRPRPDGQIEFGEATQGRCSPLKTAAML